MNKNNESSGQGFNFTILDEWKFFGRLLLRPLTLITVLVSAIALFFANSPSIDKTASLILQIVASALLAIAGGSFYDAFKNLTGNNLLEKKGSSAVRNLSLSRLKIKNISSRVKEGASNDETRNSLSLLEKDIANASQEWNDILPGVDAIEEIYTILSEKENELESAEKEKKELNEKLIRGTQLSEIEKTNLRKKTEEKENEIKSLSQEVDKLRLTTTLPASGLTVGPSGLRDWANITISARKTCSKCGKAYISTSILDSGECDDCKRKVPSSEIRGLTRHKKSNS